MLTVLCNGRLTITVPNVDKERGEVCIETGRCIYTGLEKCLTIKHTPTSRRKDRRHLNRFHCFFVDQRVMHLVAIMLPHTLLSKHQQKYQFVRFPLWDAQCLVTRKLAGKPAGLAHGLEDARITEK